MEELLKQIKKASESMLRDATAQEKKGNKAAGLRARKASLALAEKKDEYWWGTNYCGGERKCLKDITVTAMDAACRSCADSQGECSIVLTY